MCHALRTAPLVAALLSCGCQVESEPPGPEPAATASTPAPQSSMPAEPPPSPEPSGAGGDPAGPPAAGGSLAGGAGGREPSSGGAAGSAAAPEPEDPAAVLDGLRWEMGCSEARNGNLCALFPPDMNECPDDGYYAQDEQLQFGGEPGIIYDVTLRIQGTGEAGDYSGGRAEPEQFLIGATHEPGLHNLMSLAVSSPQQLYFPNAGGSGGSVQVYDYTVTIPIEGGATLTIQTWDSDCLHHRYCEDGNTDPCVGLTIPEIQEEPFDGAFLHVTVIEVAAQ